MFCSGALLAFFNSFEYINIFKKMKDDANVQHKYKSIYAK